MSDSFSSLIPHLSIFFFFFFNDTATTEIYTLSLHDALPICDPGRGVRKPERLGDRRSGLAGQDRLSSDRKSTRLNSSHGYISYAVFCLKKKKKKEDCLSYAHKSIQCSDIRCLESCLSVYPIE